MTRSLAPLLGAALLALSGMVAPALAAPDCNRMEHAGDRYSVCIVDPATADLRLFWADAAGQPYRTFGSVGASLAAGERLSFAMNGGMFGTDYEPVGLFIANGTELVAANTNEGPGNFHLMPNGVFYWSDGGAGVMETHRFIDERPAAEFATQSGPMLLIDGAVHPRFLPDSDSHKIRNGVGVLPDGRVAFVLTDNVVSFYEFALFFRDVLGASDALYLDGSVSAMYAPGIDRTGDGLFGPILAVVER